MPTRGFDSYEIEQEVELTVFLLSIFYEISFKARFNYHVSRILDLKHT